MDRMACVDIRGLPLQLLLRRHPDWEARPVAVVDHDTPLGIVQWANEPAAARRILPGMRYAAGLSLSRELRGGVVTDSEIGEAVTRTLHRLWCFSPRIEPSSRERGVFWLDATGLRHLYPSLDVWASGIREDLRQAGFRAVVAVGFSRFGSYAAARTSRRNLVFQSPEQERAYLRGVPIVRLGLDPNLRDTLFKLGIETLGGFLDLPSAGIRKRFSIEAEELHRLAKGDGWAPLVPQLLFEPVERNECFDYPEESLDRLLVRFAGLLQSLLPELSARHEMLRSVRFSLELDDGSERREEVAPAVPTLDVNELLSLLRLRLEALSLSSAAVALKVHAVGVAASQRQLVLFHDASRPDREAVHRAFAKVRAELGNDAVVYARLHDGHLPEAQYGWEPLHQLPAPKPNAVAARPLVRRVYTPPVELPPRDRREPDGWLIAGIADGPVEEVIGPQLVSGGWWLREVARAYHYVRTRSGRWLWIYHDQKRRRWFLQGEVQ
ncbi:MAG: DNA polymerase Y family protein [Candidatus Hydrogenedentes bacterium]|nr:DNA polymerase Y family protein [Candidatus Hydrogenedentota bacterium]